MKRMIILTALLGAFSIAPTARAQTRLIHCRSSQAANNYAVTNTIINKKMGCSQAIVWSTSWQKAEWAGTIGYSHDEWLTFAYGGRIVGRFYTKYASFQGQDDPTLRVQGFGSNGMFVSFMTDQ